MYLSQSSASLLNYAISLFGLCTLTVSPETLICMYMYVHVYIYTLCGCNPIFEAVVLLQHGRWKRHVVSSKVTSKQYNIHMYMYMCMYAIMCIYHSIHILGLGCLSQRTGAL